MMPPALIIWLPNTLTPSRWPAESRPLLDEPCDFVEAISTSLSGNGFNEEFGVVLPVPLRLFVRLFRAFLKNDHLGSPVLGSHLGRHFSPGNHGFAYLNTGVRGD